MKRMVRTMLATTSPAVSPYHSPGSPTSMKNAVPIATGAVIPRGADAVLMVEDTAPSREQEGAIELFDVFAGESMPPFIRVCCSPLAHLLPRTSRAWRRLNEAARAVSLTAKIKRCIVFYQIAAQIGPVYQVRSPPGYVSVTTRFFEPARLQQQREDGRGASQHLRPHGGLMREDERMRG